MGELEIKLYRCTGRWKEKKRKKKIKIIIILSTLPIQKAVERFFMLANKSTTKCHVFPAVVEALIHASFQLSLPNILTFVCMNTYYHTKWKRKFTYPSSSRNRVGRIQANKLAKDTFHFLCCSFCIWNTCS